MIVTSIINLSRKKSKVVFNEEFSLILYPGDIKRFGIREGGELAEEKYQVLVESVLKPRAREKVMHALLLSDKTEKQLNDMLVRDGFPQEAAQDAINMLKDCCYLDDEAYALRYVENQGKKKSRGKLIADMQKKGFNREQIEEILEKNPIDENAQIQEILRKKGIRPGERLDWQQYGKLAGMLARKGYSREAVSQVLRRMQEE